MKGRRAGHGEMCWSGKRVTVETRLCVAQIQSIG
jgi:hypothetical protein